MTQIELSKSARAKCKVCKGKIEKAVPRYGEEYEFRMGGETRSGIGWYHFECAVKTRPDNVASAEIADGIPNDILNQIDELKKKANRSAFTIKGIAEIDEDGKQVNCKGTVLRAMKPLQSVDPNGKDDESQTIYVEDGDTRRKVLLWGNQINHKIEKGDVIVIIRGLTDIGSDDKIQVNVLEDSQVLINPSDEALQDSIPKVKIFRSDKWNRPKDKDCVFENAKTSRANCLICEEKILKGELKIVKPLWVENEVTEQTYPGSRSFHLRCVEKDEDGQDVLKEAISRLNPEIIQQNEEVLKEFSKIISAKESKNILVELIN